MFEFYISGLVARLGRPAGFLAICVAAAFGLGMGFVLAFDERWALVFNIFLSLAALLLASLILVAGARDTAAIQIKLDELVRAVDAADNELIGIERQARQQVEEARAANCQS